MKAGHATENFYLDQNFANFSMATVSNVQFLRQNRIWIIN